MGKRLAFASIAGAVTAAVVAAVAAADVVITAVRPATARVGQVVHVEAGAYKAFARPMPLYLVPVARVPKRSTFPRPRAGIRSPASAASTSAAIRATSPRASACRAWPAGATSSSSTATPATAVSAGR
jgi:hypothetical protein